MGKATTEEINIAKTVVKAVRENRLDLLRGIYVDYAAKSAKMREYNFKGYVDTISEYREAVRTARLLWALYNELTGEPLPDLVEEYTEDARKRVQEEKRRKRLL